MVRTGRVDMKEESIMSHVVSSSWIEMTALNRQISVAQRLMRTLRSPSHLHKLLFVLATITTYAEAYGLMPDTLPPVGGWSAQGNTYFYYLDSSDILRRDAIRAFEADYNLDDSHCKTSEGDRLAHWHFESELPAAHRDGQDDYWDARFKHYGCTRAGGGSTVMNNCHSWAFDQANFAGAEYNYWINEASGPYADEMDFVGTQSLQVQADDFLRYDTSNEWDLDTHTTVVVDVEEHLDGVVPRTIKWKFRDSGIYQYQTAQDTEGGYDTPMCVGAPSVDTALSSQGWGWEYDAGGDDGEVHTPKE